MAAVVLRQVHGEAAEGTDGIIVSNDQFRDLAEESEVDGNHQRAVRGHSLRTGHRLRLFSKASSALPPGEGLWEGADTALKDGSLAF